MRIRDFRMAGRNFVSAMKPPLTGLAPDFHRYIRERRMDFSIAACFATERCSAVLEWGGAHIPPLDHILPIRYARDCWIDFKIAAIFATERCRTALTSAIRGIREQPFTVIPLCSPFITGGFFGAAFAGRDIPEILILFVGALVASFGQVILLARGDEKSKNPLQDRGWVSRKAIQWKAAARKVTNRIPIARDTLKPRALAFTFIAANSTGFILDALLHQLQTTVDIKRAVTGLLFFTVARFFAAADLAKDEVTANKRKNVAVCLNFCGLGAFWVMTVATGNFFQYVTAITGTISTTASCFTNFEKDTPLSNPVLPGTEQSIKIIPNGDQPIL